MSSNHATVVVLVHAPAGKQSGEGKRAPSGGDHGMRLWNRERGKTPKRFDSSGA